MIQVQSKIKLGGHLPAGQGLALVGASARALGYNIVQIMVGSQAERPWIPYAIGDQAAMQYKKITYGIETYVHLPFIINPCQVDKQKRGFGKNTLMKFVKVSRALGTRALVIHPGYRGAEGSDEQISEDQALENLIKFFNDLPELAEDTILLETDAGSKNGSKVGSLEFIEKALKEINHENFGMCIDTTHLYARGVDMWDDVVRQSLISVYQKRIKLVHLNSPDADVALGSHRDRHNSPFEEHHTKSDALVRDLIGRWPCILERSSMAVQEQDTRYIRTVMADVIAEEEKRAPQTRSVSGEGMVGLKIPARKPSLDGLDKTSLFHDRG